MMQFVFFLSGLSVSNDVSIESWITWWIPFNAAERVNIFLQPFFVRSWRAKSFSSHFHFHPLCNFFSIGANVRSTILLWFNISTVWFLELYIFLSNCPPPLERRKLFEIKWKINFSSSDGLDKVYFFG